MSKAEAGLDRSRDVIRARVLARRSATATTAEAIAWLADNMMAVEDRLSESEDDLAWEQRGFTTTVFEGGAVFSHEATARALSEVTTSYEMVGRWLCAVQGSLAEASGSGTAASTGPGRQQELDRDLLAIGEACAEPNWAGGGESAVDPETVGHAVLLAQLLPGWVPAPAVSPEADGDISFDWNPTPEHYVSASVGSHGRIAWAAAFGDDKRTGLATLGDGLPGALLEDLERMLVGDRGEAAHRYSWLARVFGTR